MASNPDGVIYILGWPQGNDPERFFSLDTPAVTSQEVGVGLYWEYGSCALA